MKKSNLAFMTGTLLMFLNVSAHADSTIDAHPKRNKEERTSVVKKATVQDTFAAIANTTNAFIDVRELDEVAAVSTKEAKVFPMSSLDPASFETKSGIKKSQNLYVMCRSGARSMRVATALVTEGYQHVFNVEGGIIAWEKAGLPVVKGN